MSIKKQNEETYRRRPHKDYGRHPAYWRTDIPASTLHFWQGWVLIGTLFVPMFIAGLVMIVKNHDLLRKRPNANASRPHMDCSINLPCRLCDVR